MSGSPSREAGQPVGAVQELARDDVERKKFLKMAGRTMVSGVAATGLAAFIAACGGTSSGQNASTSGPPIKLGMIDTLSGPTAGVTGGT